MLQNPTRSSQKLPAASQILPDRGFAPDLFRSAPRNMRPSRRCCCAFRHIDGATLVFDALEGSGLPAGGRKANHRQPQIRGDGLTDGPQLVCFPYVLIEDYENWQISPVDKSQAAD
ncbi:hypothetical protein CHELA20_51328 [Hyphomicrobiales bacterium]|nr:hypothetical protein CHELA20_51328 [Hyphomicrobiales bacterium]